MSNRSLKTISIILISIFLLVLVTFLTLMIASGAFLRPKYLQPWETNYYQSFEDPREQLIAHGLLASSPHNMQAWKLKLEDDSDTFTLFADYSKKMIADTTCRELMIAQGTFIEAMEIAAEKLGYELTVELFPSGLYDEGNLEESINTLPAAKFTVAEGEPAVSPLYDQLHKISTNRGNYKSTALTSEQKEEIEILSTENLRVEIFDSAQDLQRLGQYMVRGKTLEFENKELTKQLGEIFRSNEYQKNELRYGLSAEGTGYRGIMMNLAQGLVTIVPSVNSEQKVAERQIKASQENETATPAYFLIIAEESSRELQINAGRLYQRVMLIAQNLGLAVHPVSQAIGEFAEVRSVHDEFYSHYASGSEEIEMFVRIGIPEKASPSSPRMSVEGLLIKD